MQQAQQDIATVFGGTILVIHALYTEHEMHEWLSSFLQRNEIDATSSSIIDSMDIPGRDYAQLCQEIAIAARHFLVIPSDELGQDNKLMQLAYTVLGMVHEGKSVITVIRDRKKFESSNMQFLKNMTYICFEAPEYEQDKEGYRTAQEARLLEAIR